MQFVSAESGRRYDRDDVALAEAAAGRIADALDNMWLTEQHRNDRDHAAGQRCSRRGSPRSRRARPRGALLGGRRGTEVGGDFYDVFDIDDHRWAVVIGDVCGTGPDAAALTGIARHTIRAAARHGADPADGPANG